MTRVPTRQLVTLALSITLLWGCGGEDHPPGTPLGLSTSPGNRSITVSWEEALGVSFYTLYWSTSPGVTQKSNVLKRVTTPYPHFPLENGARVYYRLSATSGQGESGLSVEVSGVPSVTSTAPGSPASVAAVPGDGMVTLTWGAVAGASGYTVYRDTTSGVMPSNGTALAATGTTLVDSGLAKGTPYYYVVTATGYGQEGVPSAEVSATPTGGVNPSAPPAPTGLTATAGNQQVSLSWGASTGATSYTLYWSTSSSVSKTTGTAVAGATSPYAHSGLTNGTPYYYVVTASNASGESAASSVATATPTGGVNPTAPAAPAGLTATAGNEQVTLAWSASSGATSHTLYWGSSASVSKTTGVAIKGVTSPYLHSGLSSGTPYYYVVTASNTAGESPDSPVATATPTGGTASGYGSVTASLSGGAYGLAALTNTYLGKGKVQVFVFTSDPKGSPPGTAIKGLTVVASNALSGTLTANAGAGSYDGQTAAPLTAGTYTFSISGSVSGTLTAVVSSMPTCAVTKPTSGSVKTKGKDLPVTWSSSSSQRAQIVLKDTKGSVYYSPLEPDPGGAILPGKDIPYAGALEITVTTAWSAKATPNTGGVVCAAEGYSKITLQ